MSNHDNNTTPASLKTERSDPEIKRTSKLLSLLLRHRPCLLYTSPSPRDATLSRMPSSA